MTTEITKLLMMFKVIIEGLTNEFLVFTEVSSLEGVEEIIRWLSCGKNHHVINCLELHFQNLIRFFIYYIHL